VKMLFTTIDRQGIVSMWPIRLPGPDGRLDAWNRSAFDAAQIAMTRWIRVKANMALGAYEVFEATAPLPDPEWPTHSFRDLVEIAFKDLLIATLDHPVLRTLRGAFATCMSGPSSSVRSSLVTSNSMLRRANARSRFASSHVNSATVVPLRCGKTT